MNEDVVMPQSDSIKKLIEKVSDAVRLKDVHKITHKIKCELEDMIRNGGISLPEKMLTPVPECYARRLIHRDRELGYVMVAMTWGPGQGTPLHDHAGIWCVEGVIRGEMNVIQYELLEQKNDLYHLVETGKIRAGVGGAGALIPPYEHHLLVNALRDRPSVTLHIYGEDMDFCSAFIPKSGGWYMREQKQLKYN